jgi:DNA-binding CsgD family transcriptional regulator
MTNAAVQPGIDLKRHIEVADRRERINLLVVDCQGNIVLDSMDPSENELRTLLSHGKRQLNAESERTVRSLIDFCIRTGERHSRIAFLNAHRFVRVTRLHGHSKALFAVTVESFRGGDSLSRATRKYQLTPREIEVLAHILEGYSASETAAALRIAETTVHGYFKRLLSKTRSRNRPAMVANVLDWRGRDRPTGEAGIARYADRA